MPETARRKEGLRNAVALGSTHKAEDASLQVTPFQGASFAMGKREREWEGEE